VIDAAAALRRIVAGDRGVEERRDAAAPAQRDCVVDAAAVFGGVVGERRVDQREEAAVVDAAAVEGGVARDGAVDQRGLAARIDRDAAAVAGGTGTMRSA